MKNNVRDKDRDKEITMWNIWACIDHFISKCDNQDWYFWGQTCFRLLHKCVPPHEVPWLYWFCENSSFHYSLMYMCVSSFHYFFKLHICVVLPLGHALFVVDTHQALFTSCTWLHWWLIIRICSFGPTLFSFYFSMLKAKSIFTFELVILITDDQDCIAIGERHNATVISHLLGFCQHF